VPCKLVPVVCTRTIGYTSIWPDAFTSYPPSTFTFMWTRSSLFYNSSSINFFGKRLWLFLTFIMLNNPNLRKAYAHFTYPNHASATRYRPVPWYGYVTRRVVAVVCPYSSNHYFSWSISLPSTTSAASMIPVIPQHRVLIRIPSGVGFLMINYNLPLWTPLHPIIVSSITIQLPALNASLHF
jgi:hypothetical protein